MNNVFSKYLDRFVLVLLDGILIYFKNEEEHVEHLRLTLNCLGSIRCMQDSTTMTYMKIEFIIWATLLQIDEYMETMKRLRP